MSVALLNRPRQAVRLAYISWILLRFGLDEIILATHLFRPIRFLIYLLPWHWNRKIRQRPRGERIRLALEALGPIFIKFGQALSTRPDLIPADIVIELAKLQDNVPPFPSRLARETVEKQLGCPIREIFESFDDSPLASASVAQVHAARLKSGKRVVVKIIRPGIYKIIRNDMSLLRVMAELAEQYWPLARHLCPVEVVNEFESYLFDELDLQREAANASQLRRNFEKSKTLYIPEIYWDYTRRHIMVMERISGTRISDIDELKEKGCDLKLLAERGVDIFFTQVFSNNFFHADMHPGNIFVDLTDSKDPRYIAIDFGIVGSLSPIDQHYLAHNFHAFFKRDYRRVAELHQRSGWIPKTVRIDEFESAIRTVCEPIFEKPLKDISFGVLLISLFQALRRFDVQIQPQLLLLQKTVLNIEGLGRTLYPELDLWQTGKPFMEKWMHSQMGGKQLMNRFKENLPLWVTRLPDLPEKITDALELVEEGRDAIRQHQNDIDALRRSLQKRDKRQALVIVGSTLIFTSLLLAGIHGQPWQTLLEIPHFSWIVGAAGIVLAISGWIGRRS